MTKLIETIIMVCAGLSVSVITYIITKRSNKLDDAASKTDVEKSLKEAKTYTDKAIIDHEKVHYEIRCQYEQIQSDLTLIKNHLMKK